MSTCTRKKHLDDLPQGAKFIGYQNDEVGAPDLELWTCDMCHTTFSRMVKGGMTEAIEIQEKGHASDYDL